MTTVTVLLVSHDGSRWLPAVLAGLARQTRPADRVVAVDTGSGDGSADLLRGRLGQDAVVLGRPEASYADSVRQGLATLPAPVEDEWVWLLHDDSNPAPTALEHLLEAAAPGVAVLGPKLREWPSLRRLLEVGVTISGTGRRETGLERGEYDQGQHDRIRDVLAVNTAGMLVRRSVLEEIGFDPRLPVFNTDLDFGWRVARAGHRTIVVPDAVVFHAEAAHRGIRRTDLTGRHFHRAERQAALYTLLVNGSTPGLPWRLLRLLVGSLLRILGFLLVRSPGEAYDELVALASTYLRPHRIISGRRARSRTATVSHGDVKHLLAPTWLPYRHGLDFVSDVAAAVVNQVGDLTEARRARGAPVVPAETGPVDEESESLAPDSGALARLLTNPIAGVFAVLVVLAFVGMRDHVGDGMLSGGALLPAPDAAGHWWSTYVSGRHDLGVGSTGPAAPYLLPLAVAGTLFVGKAWLVVDLIFLFAVPLASWGAFRFLRRLTGSWVPALLGGVAYGLVPVLSGAVAQGRLGTVVAALLLPWLAQAASFLVHPSADRRWRAAFRTALLLFVVAAFAPVAWIIAALATVLALVLLPEARRHPAPVLTGLGLGGALLLPWLVLTWAHHGVASYLFEAGRPASDLMGDLGPFDLLTGRPGEVGSAPVWLSAALVLGAAAALARRDTRPRVLAAWVLALVGLAVAVVLGRVEVTDPITGVVEPIWLGLPLVVAQGAFVVILAVVATGIRDTFAGRAFGWRQPVVAALGVGVIASLLGGLGWWAVTGAGDELDRRGVTSVPEFMTDAARAEPARGILVVRGDQADGFRHVLLRDRGLRVGDDSAFPTAEEQEPVSALVTTLASAPTAATSESLLDAGVQYVYAPRPVDPRLAGNLDSLSGLVPASALARGARAWQVDGSPVGRGYADGRSGGIHPWLVAAQLLAIVVTVVFAAPTRRRVRDR